MYDEVLREVEGRIADNGSAGKADIGALVFWKRIQANAKWVLDLHRVSDEEVRRVTGRAVRAVRAKGAIVPERAEAARTELQALPGFRSRASYSVASALLVAASPDTMAVYDKRARIGLTALGVAFQPEYGYGAYMTLIESMRHDVNTAQGLSWTARDVDLGLFLLGGEPRAAG
ncbi:hypothetical protein F1C76_02060 [Geodermatophilaceae bacterium NBWT11]|nr:hypothetical protein F1C76_02060 [Geodermatophilaceae bacterium NBWT11]